MKILECWVHKQVCLEGMRRKHWSLATSPWFPEVVDRHHAIVVSLYISVEEDGRLGVTPTRSPARWNPEQERNVLVLPRERKQAVMVFLVHEIPVQNS